MEQAGPSALAARRFLMVEGFLFEERVL